MVSQHAASGRRQNPRVIMILINIVFISALLYVLFLALMFVGQRSFIYFPDTRRPSPAEGGVAEMREVTLNTTDGLELLAWYAPPGDAAKPVVVLFHGNAGNIADRGFKARLFMDHGYGALLVEYRGYGANPGSPTEPGLLMDGRAALAFLAAEGISAKGVVLYGESLGSGVAVAMAMEQAFFDRAVAALVLEAPFSSAADAARYHMSYMPAGLLLKDKFNSMPLISAVRTPLLVVHGDRDGTIPQRLGRRLFAAAREPKQALWLEGAGHNNLYAYGAGEAMVGFLDALPTTGATTGAPTKP